MKTEAHPTLFLPLIGNYVGRVHIDGQQRLSTLLLLLIAQAKAVQASPSPTSVSYEEIYDSYLINKHGSDIQHDKLLLTQSDKDTLLTL